MQGPIHDQKPKKAARNFKLSGITWNLCAFIVMYIADFTYRRTSDVRCPFAQEARCMTDFVKPHLRVWALQLVSSSTMFCLLMIYSITGKRLFRFVGIVALANVAYLTCYYNDKLNHQNYGQVFGSIFQVLTLIILLGLIVAKGILWFLHKNAKRTILMLSFIILLCHLLIHFKGPETCGNWDAGLSGKRIQNDNISCSVTTVSICWFDLEGDWLHGWFPVDKCNPYVDPELMALYYPNTPFVGFPRLEKLRRKGYEIVSKVYRNLIPLNSLEDKRAKGLEIVLNKTDSNNPSFIIQVQRDENLVKERKQIDSSPMSKNVLMIFIDALSRSNAHRKLAKTMSWFDEVSGGKHSTRQAFEFFKYHAIAPHTTPNMYAVFHGIDYPLKNPGHISPSALDSFKSKGFITGRTCGMCLAGDLIIDEGDWIPETKLDHEGFGFSCDPHYSHPSHPFGRKAGPYSTKRRCLYGKDVHEYSLEYADKFWRAYSSEKKFFHLSLLDAHEPTNQAITYVDDHVEAFLRNLDLDGLLEDTIIIFYSDHGPHSPSLSLLFQTEDVLSEIYLPTLIMIVPKSLDEKLFTNVTNNQQILVSAKEIHKSLLVIQEGIESENLRYSLFGKIPAHRSCQDIDIGLIEKCACNI